MSIHKAHKNPANQNRTQTPPQTRGAPEQAPGSRYADGLYGGVDCLRRRLILCRSFKIFMEQFACWSSKYAIT